MGTPDRSRGVVEDQASGLRRLLQRATCRICLIGVATNRSQQRDRAIADQVLNRSDVEGDCLFIDATRSGVPSLLGVRLKFDLQQALTGHCSLEDACPRVSTSLRAVAALRAFDSPDAAREPLPNVLERMFPAYRSVMVLVPAARLTAIRRHLPEGYPVECLLVMASEPGDVRTGMSLIARSVREAGIDDFQVLFPGLDVGSAGRLSSAMSMLAMRHFGARLSAAPLTGAWPIGRDSLDGPRPLEKVC